MEVHVQSGLVCKEAPVMYSEVLTCFSGEQKYGGEFFVFFYTSATR